MIYLLLFWIFFKIGLFTFGGGYAMIPLMQQELIAKSLTTETELFNFIAISEATPGPFAINVATFVGYSNAGLVGSIIATLGLVTPSLIIIILIAALFNKINENKYVNNFLKGVRPIVIGLIAFVAIKLIFTQLCGGFDFTFFDYKPLIIMAITIVLKLTIKKMSPILFIVIGASLGILLYMI